MTIKSSGSLAMSEIVAEFGGTAPYLLSQYYRGGARVPNGPAANGNIPTSGVIKFSDFYGATSVQLPVLQAAFSLAPNSGVAPLTVNFTNASTGAVAYLWEFGDWMAPTSSGVNASYTYTGAGTFTVMLTAADGLGNTSINSWPVTVTVNPLAPVADYNWVPTQGALPVTVTFNNTSTNNPTSYLWTFADGATSTLASPTHTYNSTGLFKVKLVASNSHGSSSVGGFISITQ